MRRNALKNARQRLAQEKGAIIKDWGGRLPLALIYPNSYHLGMSNLGIHAIYHLLNSYGDVVCERVFWEKETSPDPAISRESQRQLGEFAVLAFSITYELDYFNVVPILKSSHIPLYAADRDSRHPLVIAGGACITANPMPLAPFFDCLCIGEAEAILPAMLPVLSEGTAGRRDEVLEELAKLPGIYVPMHHPGKRVARQWLKNLDDYPTHTIIITPDTELGNLYLIEAERGCPWHCRFCLVNNVFRPMRSRSIESLIEQAREGLKYRKRLGLVGPAVSDHPHIEELLARFLEMGAELAISSLRVSSVSPKLLAELARGGVQTVTIAPEAGSPRLRRIINKAITEDNITEVVSQVAKLGIKQLKLYFMIGLPTETDEDIAETINLTLRYKNILDRQKTGCRIAVTISPFVPKAGTPFQWLPAELPAVLNRRLAMLKNSLEPKGIKVKSESPAWSQVQTVLSRGDTEIAKVLASMENISLSGWRREVGKHRLDVDFYAHRRWDTGQKLPWAVLDSGTTPERLADELARALR